MHFVHIHGLYTYIKNLFSLKSCRNPCGLQSLDSFSAEAFFLIVLSPFSISSQILNFKKWPEVPKVKREA